MLEMNISGPTKYCDSKVSVNTSFGRLIERAQSLNPTPTHEDRDIDIFDALKDWRIQRNEYLHAVAKSEPGEATDDVMLFLNGAKIAAEQGKKLARLVCKWGKLHRRVIL